MNAGTPLASTFGTRRRGVLAFTFAVHLLALFLWTQERRLLPAPSSRVVTIPERYAGPNALPTGGT